MALPQAELFEDQFPLVRSCPTLNEIRLAQDIKDLTIEVKDGCVLYVHRIILAARIPSLRAALSGPLGEENSKLRWPTVPLSLADALVRYVYTGQVEMTQANVRGMVTLARMLKLPDLVKWGVTFMAKGVNLGNLPATWDFARSLNAELLVDTCISLMKEHFEHFVPTDLFVRLPAETVLTLLRSEDLSVGSEEQVIAAIARWAGSGDGAASEKLKIQVPAMLKEVQWHLTTAQCRDRLMENYPAFHKSLECSWLMARIANWIGASDKDKPPCPFNVRPRVRQAFFLFGEDKDRSRWTVLRADPRLQGAEQVAGMEERWWASYNVVGESIFVVGGEWDGSTRVDEFLVREGRWRQRAPLAIERRWHAATVMKVHVAAAAHADADGEKSLIGVFGGWGGERLSSCELYDVSQNRWHKLPDMREKRDGPAAACLPGDSRVFVFGGRDDRAPALASVAFCHLRADWREKATLARTEDFWLPAAPMRTARRGLAATPFRGAILVAGGYDGRRTVNVVEMFTPPDARCPLGQWTALAGMREPRSWFTLLTSANAVLALGGSDIGQKNTVEALTAPGVSVDFDNDLTSWIWSSKDSVETLNWIIGAASVRM
ncbi:hypothetical protein SprV_0401689000 [Sparganum proliferum]